MIQSYFGFKEDQGAVAYSDSILKQAPSNFTPLLIRFGGSFFSDII